MSVEEHTAQWAPDKASKIQDEFVRGKLNVLSCSTTFEMGVGRWRCSSRDDAERATTSLKLCTALRSGRDAGKTPPALVVHDGTT